jgi:hypothetical protein
MLLFCVESELEPPGKRGLLVKIKCKYGRKYDIKKRRQGLEHSNNAGLPPVRHWFKFLPFLFGALMDGWILLHRKLGSSPLWLDDTFTRGQAWVDLIMLANHTKGHIRVQGMKISLNRGDVGESEVTLSNRWRWSRGKVRRFLDELEEEKMIEKKTHDTADRRKSVITILNYNTYQEAKKKNGTGDSTGDSTGDGQATDRRRYSNKEEVKNDKEEKSVSDPAPKVPAKNGFDFGFAQEQHRKPLQDFVEMRKASKKSLTQRALELNYKVFLKAADHFNSTFEEVVDFTVMKTWMSPNINFMENAGFGSSGKQSPQEKAQQTCDYFTRKTCTRPADQCAQCGAYRRSATQ